MKYMILLFTVSAFSYFPSVSANGNALLEEECKAELKTYYEKISNDKKSINAKPTEFKNCIGLVGGQLVPPKQVDTNATTTSALAFNFGDNTNVASLRFGGIFNSEYDIEVLGDQAPVVSLNINTPFNDNGERSLNSLDAFAGKTSFELSIQGGKPVLPNSEQNLLRICNAYRKSVGLRGTNDIRKDCILRRDDFNSGVFDDVAKTAFNLANTYNFYGLKATGAYESFDFFDEAEPDTKKNLDEWDAGYKLYFGRNFTKGKSKRGYSGSFANLFFEKRYSISASLDQKRAHTAQQEQNICSPVGESGDLSCANKIIGKPTKETSRVFTLTFGKEGKHLAFNLDLKRDLENDISAVSWPIWLMRDKDRAWQGGIQFDWNENDDDVSAAVFINTPFSLGNR